MKSKVIVAASLLAAAPALTNVASAASQSHGSWSFTDYTPDTTVLAAGQALHVATGKTDTSYCHGGRVPSAPQDVTSHRLSVSAPAVLRMAATASGVWGFELNTRRGTTLASATTETPGSPAFLTVRLRPGTYVVTSCNLGGAPTAHVTYRLTR